MHRWRSHPELNVIGSTTNIRSQHVLYSSLSPLLADRMGDAYDELQRALKLHVQLKSPARAQAETLQQMVLCLTYI